MTKTKDRHLWQRVSKNADETEFRAIHEGGASLVDGVSDDRMSGELDDAADEAVRPLEAGWQAQSVEFDEAAGRIRDEMIKRAGFLGQAYPFDVNGSGISVRDDANLLYEFLLAATLTKELSKAPFNKITWAFENITAGLVASHFGPEARGIATGKASAATGGSFKSLFEFLNKETLEWVWLPQPEFNPSGPRGDEKLDFIVWRPFMDRRQGAYFLIGQCACGDDWEKKTKEVQYNELRRWFTVGARTEEPTRSFATCYALSDGNIIHHTSTAGIIFDRLRLMKAFWESGEAITAPIERAMKQCIAAVAATLGYQPRYAEADWITEDATL